jgi:hypothetical protein
MQRRNLGLVKVALLVPEPRALGMSTADRDFLALSIDGVDRTLAWIEANMTDIREFIRLKRGAIENADDA